MFKAARFEDREFRPLSIAVVAVSDTRTLETDTGGALLKSLLETDGHRCFERIVVRDDVQKVRAVVQTLVANPDVDVVLTTGGTGFSGRDVTPEAVEPLFDKRMEGFSVLFHHCGHELNPVARDGWADRRDLCVLPARLTRGVSRRLGGDFNPPARLPA
jgi:molybdenum cofactor biosynthesis protein B